MPYETFKGIVFTKEKLSGIEFCNLGKELCLRLQEYSANKATLPFLVEEILDDIISEFTFTNEDGDKYLAFENISVIFENALGVNVNTFIAKASKGVCLYILSEHKAENTAYYPFPGNLEYKIELEGKSVRQTGYVID